MSFRIGQNSRTMISQILEIIPEICQKSSFGSWIEGNERIFPISYAWIFNTLNHNTFFISQFFYWFQSIVSIINVNFRVPQGSKHLWIVDSHNYIEDQIFSFDGTVVSFENFTPLRAIIASESSLISSPSPSRTITSKQLSWSRWICTEDFIRLE